MSKLSDLPNIGKEVERQLNQVGIIISLPNLKGQLEQFEVWEKSNFDPILQSNFPEIRSYVGKSLTDKYATLYFSLAPIGFQGFVSRVNGLPEFIEAYNKNTSTYVLFSSKNNNLGKSNFKCGTIDSNINIPTINNSNRTSAGQLKTMRVALGCNGEYAQHFGGTVSGALAGMNASLTEVNALFERDLAIHLTLIANTTSLIYLNPATDPYSNGAIGSQNDVWNLEFQNTISSVIGNAAYDVGHLLCKTGGGGNAGCLGCVCDDDDVANLTDKNKGSGFTSPESDTAAPEGSVFNFDFLAHEFGHQFGGYHTFSYEFQGGTAQVEPGSGCATMAYAGVAGTLDVQPHNLVQFATFSILQVQANMATKTCPVNTSTSNAPIVNAGANYTIPKGTAFILTGSATDADAGDVLTYSWEQNDESTEATAGANSTTTDTKLVGPTFRINEVSTSPSRYLPKLEYVLNGQLTNPANWESVSNVARDLNFTFTARDNHAVAGQTATGSMVVTVANIGPFTVTSQNTSGIVWNPSESKTITWNVNSSSTLSGAANVDIMLSTDGGLTFPTALATNVTNNGTNTITVPNMASTTCRIMVKPTGNIFYAVNSTPFTISTLATTNFDFANFNLYPNPNQGEFTISFNSLSEKEIQIQVNDVRGRKIYSNTYANEGFFNKNIKLKNAQAGMYFVAISDGENTTTKKIIVK